MDFLLGLMNFLLGILFLIWILVVFLALLSGPVILLFGVSEWDDLEPKTRIVGGLLSVLLPGVALLIASEMEMLWGMSFFAFLLWIPIIGSMGITLWNDLKITGRLIWGLLLVLAIGIPMEVYWDSVAILLGLMNFLLGILFLIWILAIFLALLSGPVILLFGISEWDDLEPKSRIVGGLLSVLLPGVALLISSEMEMLWGMSFLALLLWIPIIGSMGIALWKNLKIAGRLIWGLLLVLVIGILKEVYWDSLVILAISVAILTAVTAILGRIGGFFVWWGGGE